MNVIGQRSQESFLDPMVSGQYRFLEATYVEPAFIATGISRVRMK